MPQVDWSLYADAYDLMAAHNPAYQAIHQEACRAFAGHEFRPGDIIADVGAGTGNFSIAIAALLPQCEVLHVEPDLGMAKKAQAKAAARGLKNWKLELTPAELFAPLPRSLAAVVTVHTLYIIHQPLEMMKYISGRLRPGGMWFVCDLGRKMAVWDWTRYLWAENVKHHGLLKTVRMFANGYAVLSANRAIAKLQRNGRFWQHEPHEFYAALAQCGLSIVKQEAAYRGYSDLAICFAPQ